MEVSGAGWMPVLDGPLTAGWFWILPPAGVVSLVMIVVSDVVALRDRGKYQGQSAIGSYSLSRSTPA